jgi:hypothetical protein
MSRVKEGKRKEVRKSGRAEEKGKRKKVRS